MNKVFKRLLSVMLALVMVVGMVPVSAVKTEAAETKTLYLKVDSSWTSDAPGIYLWNSSDTLKNNGGPVGMTLVEGSTYKYELTATDVSNNYDKVIFSRRAAWNVGQTGDITIGTDDMWTIDSNGTCTGGTYSGTTDTPTEGTTRIYLDTRNYMPSGWGEAYLYMWDPNTDNSGKTVKMNSVEENGETVKGLFYYDVPTGYQMIFKPNKDNWSGKTGNQSMPTDGKNIFICKTFNTMTTGEWGKYGTTDIGNNFPSNVTGKVTFFDLYTDTEINKNQNPENDPEYYYLDSWKYSDNSAFNVGSYSFTSIGRAFSNNVNKKIKAYWSSVKTSDNKSVSPLYFGNFQPFYLITGGNESKDMGKQDPWWTDNNSFKQSDNWSANRTGYMNAVYGNADDHDIKDFSYFLNRSVDANVAFSGSKGETFYLNADVVMNNNNKYWDSEVDEIYAYLWYNGNTDGNTQSTKITMTPVSDKAHWYSVTLPEDCWKIKVQRGDHNTGSIEFDDRDNDSCNVLNINGWDSVGWSGETYPESDGSAKYGAVVQGIVADELVNGNIVAKGTSTVLPQFNKAFYYDADGNALGIGKYYETMDFPFVIRALDTNGDGKPDANYYQFDSGVNGSSNRDIVRMNADGTALTYYDGTADENEIVYGITAEEKRTPGFFPFNDPGDSSGESYCGTGNKLNYGFGMKLEIEFTVNKDGTVKDLNGEEIPAVFEFSGDDDVWIYVDDKLALDLGGSHGVAQGKLDFSKQKAVVQYVKGLYDDDENKTELTDLADILARENKYDKEDYVNKLSSTNAFVRENVSLNIENEVNVTPFAIDMNDETKIHTLTIFYEERGMFESNFKATFNLEQPTVLKTTNTVNVDGVNSALQAATKTAAENDTFTYTVKATDDDAAEDKSYYYYKNGTSTSTRYDDKGVTLKNGEYVTFVKQFDRGSTLGLSQIVNDKYNTSWVMSDFSDAGLGDAIAASYEKDSEGNLIRNSLTVSDSRITNSEGATDFSSFELENYYKNAEDIDESIPAKVQVDYVQTPKTGGIAVLKALETDLKADTEAASEIFNFTVYFSNIFGVKSDEAKYDVSYDVYRYSGESSTLVSKDKKAEDGVIALKAGQFAIINGIPIGTSYRVVENEEVSYSVTNLDVTTNKHNDEVTGILASGTVTGTVAEDADANVDMFVYTNGKKKAEDSFLVEIGKTNTLNVIPTKENDGELSGFRKDINTAWTSSTADYKGFVFVVTNENGEDVLQVNDNGEPLTELTVDDVTYTVKKDNNGNPVIEVTPSAGAVSEKSTITLKYQLVELTAEGKVKYTKVKDEESETKYTDQLDAITPVITMTNYLYKANDDVYVLDYGLDVDLAEKSGSGLFENDSLANPSLTGTTSTYWNTAKGKIVSKASADTKADQNTLNVIGTYGTIKPTADDSTEFLIDAVTTGDDENKTVHNPKITYSLDKFLNAKDSFNYGVMIQTAGAAADQTSNRFRLNVTSNISIYPANVVYYEDSFTVSGATDSTAKIVYSGTVETEGKEYDLTQSNDQSEQYGYDDAYTDDDTTVATGDSAGSSTKLTANGYNTKAVFTFTGTGFDIIARTNNSTAGIFCIIDKVNDNGTLETVKTVGVDTYYANGDLYQIPVIHEDVSHGTYQVTLGIKAASNGNNVIYLDGIRIYNPLGTLTDEAKKAYIDNEEGATFVKVSDLILGSGEITETGIIKNGKNVIEGQSIEDSTVALLRVGTSDGKPFEALGYSRVENVEDGAATTTKSVLTYLNAGPNNEVYLDDEGIFAFIAERDPSDPNATIQIEAKLLNTNMKSGATVSEGKLELSILDGTLDDEENPVAVNSLVVSSSTAMYYEIPVEECIKLTERKYLVAIQGDYDQNKTLCVSLSNMKYKGYTISNPLDNEVAVGSYIEKYTDTECVFEKIVKGTSKESDGESVGSLSLERRTWYENTYSIVLTKDVFEGDTEAAFTMYYVKASGAKTPITVTAVEINPTKYSLTFKSPNAVGEFPVELHYLLADGTESPEYFATTMSVTRK